MLRIITQFLFILDIMPLTREKKKQILEELKQLLDTQKAIIFADFHGLKTQELLELKKKLKTSQSVFKVAKKTLLELTFKEKGFKDLAQKVRQLQGQVAAIFGLEDEIQPSKAVSEFAKGRTTFKILGGVFDKVFKGVEAVEELAALPSPQQLKAKFLGVLANPLQGLVYALRGNILKLIHILQTKFQ